MILLIEDDQGKKIAHPFSSDEITVGREKANTVLLPERNVSRRHARLLKVNGGIYLEDLGSSNGTRVNGERIEGRRKIRTGDLIQIGDYDIALQEAQAQQPAPPAPQAAAAPARPPGSPAGPASGVAIAERTTPRSPIPAAPEPAHAPPAASAVAPTPRPEPDRARPAPRASVPETAPEARPREQQAPHRPAVEELLKDAPSRAARPRWGNLAVMAAALFVSFALLGFALGRAHHAHRDPQTAEYKKGP